MTQQQTTDVAANLVARMLEDLLPVATPPELLGLLDEALGELVLETYAAGLSDGGDRNSVILTDQISGLTGPPPFRIVTP